MQKSPVSFKKINLNEALLVCSCKKSFCLKKYCECYQAGMKCNSSCKCVDCHNKSSNNGKKLFEISGMNEKRERFNSEDTTLSNFQMLEFKKVNVEPQQIIINNYDINTDVQRLDIQHQHIEDNKSFNIFGKNV